MNQEFKEIVDVVVECAKAYATSREDGKIDLGDLGNILPPLLKLPAAIKGSPEAFKNLEIEQIKDSAIEILEAAGEMDGKVKFYVEGAIDAVNHVVGLLDLAKKMKAGPVAPVAEIKA